MARTLISYNRQTARIQFLLQALEQLQTLSHPQLITRPGEKKWCIAEVLQHMVIAHRVYIPKMERALSQLPPASGGTRTIKARPVASYLIQRFPPVPASGKIRMKMKTMKQFEPQLDPGKTTYGDVQRIIQDVADSLRQLDSWIHLAAEKDVQRVRFNSAIGAMVRFNVAEACEFILCHNERHFQQIRNIANALR